MKTLFIHRSVGENLIHDGGIYELLGQRDVSDFSDFNQNTGVLRDRGGSQKTTYEMPGGDTHPSNYAEFFSQEFHSDFKDFVLSHERVIIKSCYPNSNITSDEGLETIKQQYRQIVADFSANAKGRLVVMTSPPLRPSSTTTENAKRAKELTKWLASQQFDSRVHVFDFFSLLANNEGYLKKEYRRLLWLDNHPNKLASETIAALWVKELLI